MTTAMKLREEGREEGREEEGKKRLLEAIADILEIKFGKEELLLMDKVREVKDIKELENIKEKIKKAESLEQMD